LVHALDYLAQTGMVYRLSALSQSNAFGSSEVNNHTPEADLQQRQLGQKLRRLVEQLPSLEREIIEQYYFQGMQFIEIAKASDGLSKSWISRLHARAIKRLKKLYLLEQEGDEA